MSAVAGLIVLTADAAGEPSFEGSPPLAPAPVDEAYLNPALAAQQDLRPGATLSVFTAAIEDLYAAEETSALPALAKTEVTVTGITVGLRVVGRAAFPSSDQDSLADGAGLTRAGLDRLRTSEEFTNLVLTWAPGTDAEAARSRVENRFGTTFAVVVPAEVANLARVARLPAMLGGFLAAAATLAVGQAVVSGVRRRQRDLAVLRALGFVRHQVAGPWPGRPRSW